MHVFVALLVAVKWVCNGLGVLSLCMQGRQVVQKPSHRSQGLVQVPMIMSS